jgi:hypothetical protein
MPAGKYTFIIEQGTTHEFTIVKKDSNGDAVDLTGYTARMQIRPDFADLTTTVYTTVSSSIAGDGTGLYITPESGSIDVLISAQVTEGFDFDTGFYDLELYSGSIVERLLQGKVKINREVTRA